MDVRTASPTMVGRTAELAELREALKSAEAERALAIIVGGEAGVGKTRLVEEFVGEAAATGALVVIGQCVELGEDGLPYAPVVGAIRGLIAHLGPEVVIDRAGPGRDSLAGLIPELGLARLGDGVDAERLFDSHTGRSRLFEVIVGLLEKTATDQPLVVVIEDLHWADQSTRDLLRYVARSLDASPVLIVATYRSDEIHRGHALRPFLAELDRMRNVRRLEVPRLTRAQVSEQLGAILSDAPEPGLAERVYERSEGIPFFVEELLDAERGTTSGPLPDSLRDLLLVRFEQVSPETQDVLRVLAVGGNRVEHAVLTAVRGADPEGLDAALREAISVNIVRVSGDGYDFRHALVREAIHGDLLPGEHARKHLRFAEVLEERPALVGSGSAYVEIAHHYYSAHDLNKAFGAYLRASDEAINRFAYGEAQRMGERALELWDRVDDPVSLAGHDRVKLLTKTARAAYDAGETERGLALVQEALRETSPANATRYANLLWNKARFLGASGRPGGMAVMQSALDLVPADPPTELRAALLEQQSGRHMLDGRFEEAFEKASEALAMAELLNIDWIISSARNVRGVALVNFNRVEAGLADLEAAREYAGDEPRQLMRYHINTSDALSLLGRFSAAVAVAEAGMERAQGFGLTRSAGAMLAGNAAEPLLAIGQWDRADELVTWALSAHPSYAHLVHLLRLRAWLSLWRGDVERAAADVAEMQSLVAGRHAEPQSTLSLATVVAEVELARGNPDRAWTEVAAAMAGSEQAFPGYDVRLLATAAHALAARPLPRSDDFDADRRWLAERLDHYADWESGPLWCAVFHAELSGPGARGDDPDAWRAAVVAAGAAAGPIHLRGYASLRLGRALIAGGERDAADDALGAADLVAEQLGSGLIRDQVHALRERAGLIADSARSPRRAGVSTEAAGMAAEPTLTAREAQVLRLVAAGLSNRQIGEKLFISTKTASVHVSNILAKLGVASRTEAAYAARRDGLLTE